MKKIAYLFCLSLVAMLNPVLMAQPTDLFISEYVEGSSFNKALEIYNGTNTSVNLATGQYVLEVYFNGSTSSTSLALTGTIPSGSVYVLAHPSALLSMTPDVSTSVVNFNGDDAIVLRKGGITGPVVDVIGQVGLDPGTQWGLNDTATLDRTMRRKISICQGDITTSNAFYTAPEWEGYPINTFGGLGTHSATCGPTVNPGAGIVIAPAGLSFTTLVNVPSPPQSYAVTGNSLTAPVLINVPVNFEMSFNSGGPFLSSLSIPTNSFNSGPVTVFVRYNPVSIGTNSGVATHSSTPFSGTLNLSGVAIGLTAIAQIQGAGATGPFLGQLVATEGIVTADFQGTNELGGFFIQDPVGDSNPLTSEGIFIFNTSFPVSVGDLVKLSGTADEFFNKTQIKTLTSLSVQGVGSPITPMSVTLPFATMTEAEKWEGMLVQFTQTLSVTEVYTLARYGEVSLSVNGRLFTPTNFVDPNDNPAAGTTTNGASNVAAVIAQQDLNNRSRILLDDKSSVQNPAVVPYVDPVNNTLRCGSAITGLTGIMDYDFGVYRIQPVGIPVFNYAARPVVPSVGVSNVKVASFNVLNYFNGNGAGGGFPTSRGANTMTEFTRQRTKIIEAIKQIDADVVGLMEMENDGNGPQSAIQDLVNGLNTTIGATTYTFVADPTSANGGTGTDEIKVALIYKPSVLATFSLSVADDSTVHNRPPLAQTFIQITSQEKFSVIVNHFKSKSCSGSTGTNTDQGDGQSCFNASRKNQAGALLVFINNVQTLSGDSDIVVMGDINAYEQEDPIDMLLAGGLKPVIANAYSYVFDGQSGSLDHALVSTPLLAQVSGAAKWHINADEPIAKDYNQEFNPAYMYDPGPFRSSDHDPVIVGLKLGAITPTLNTGIAVNENTSLLAKIRPNPSSQEEVTLDLFENKSLYATIEVVDQMGSCLMRITPALATGNNSLKLNLPELKAGLYHIKITTDIGTSVQKLIILK
ncbi:MAG: ExeM/NucH family extracellular endonuclease [Bacteroidota bacterium]